MNQAADTLKKEIQNELTENILPYWMNHMTDDENGGFYGRITGNGVLMPNAEKGAVLNARILWTFSAAYRVLRQDKYLVTASRAKRYLIDHFYDQSYGGIYWSLDKNGEPLDTKKTNIRNRIRNLWFKRIPSGHG